MGGGGSVSRKDAKNLSSFAPLRLCVRPQIIGLSVFSATLRENERDFKKCQRGTSLSPQVTISPESTRGPSLTLRVSIAIRRCRLTTALPRFSVILSERSRGVFAVSLSHRPPGVPCVRTVDPFRRRRGQSHDRCGGQGGDVPPCRRERVGAHGTGDVADHRESGHLEGERVRGGSASGDAGSWSADFQSVVQTIPSAADLSAQSSPPAACRTSPAPESETPCRCT
jgi:hypothetical protein